MKESGNDDKGDWRSAEFMKVKMMKVNKTDKKGMNVTMKMNKSYNAGEWKWPIELNESDDDGGWNWTEMTMKVNRSEDGGK